MIRRRVLKEEGEDDNMRILHINKNSADAVNIYSPFVYDYNVQTDYTTIAIPATSVLSIEEGEFDGYTDINDFMSKYMIQNSGSASTTSYTRFTNMPALEHPNIGYISNIDIFPNVKMQYTTDTPIEDRVPLYSGEAILYSVYTNSGVYLSLAFTPDGKVFRIYWRTKTGSNTNLSGVNKDNPADCLRTSQYGQNTVYVQNPRLGYIKYTTKDDSNHYYLVSGHRLQ